MEKALKHLRNHLKKMHIHAKKENVKAATMKVSIKFGAHCQEGRNDCNEMNFDTSAFFPKQIFRS